MSAEVTTVLAEEASSQVLSFSLQQKAKRQSEDAQKNHELSQKKLLSHEARRISIILEKCISKAEIAATLPALLQLDGVSSILDKELSRALEAHKILHERLETLEGLKQESDGEQEGEIRETKRRARAQLERDVKNSVRDLFRLVRAHPDAFFGLRTELGMKVGESEYTLIRGLKRFHGHIIEKLLTSIDEELQLVLAKQVSSSQAHDMEQIVSAEQMVAEAIKRTDAEISERNEEIKKLDTSLQESTAQEAVLSALVDKECQSHLKTSKMKQASIQQEIDQLNIQFNNVLLENRATERAIQEKNEKLETEIEYLLQTFDDEIEEKQADLEISEVDFERDEGELKKLEKLYAVIEVKCNQIQEKRRLAEERRKEEMKELELKTRAAILAQAWWRGYSTRKALKGKTKGKKGKKGKGKKTK
ncbi:dynein regulatory complex protein 10 [Thunnus maccoyii]|uniref:dynein regulatory complex protein 10 n=1 Tax=Thunnus maccoyii TaxID=8240 RepID=UPI001C4C0824|nr:dynein regulatory complex protein 10 [Thunnus maccoyii]